MIDFRYHLVSLISVFLALAVGIILGAGPLKEAIGDQLSGQVTSLRTEKDALRGDLNDAQATQKGSDALLEASAPKALAGALPARRVAIVLVGDVDSQTVDDASSYLKTAGASVVSRVQLADSWFSADAADSRQSYASSLADYLAAGASPQGYDATLAHAFVLAFSGYATVEGNTFSPGADVAREILVQSGLVSVVSKPVAPADAYVVIEQGEVAPGSPSPDALSASESTVAATFASALAQDSEGAVVTSVGPADGTIVAAVEGDGSASDTVTTLAGVDSEVGRFMLPLALSERIAGTTGEYADTSAAKAIPTPGVLGPPDRSGLVALSAAASTDDATSSTTQGEHDGSRSSEGKKAQGDEAADPSASDRS